MSATLPQTDEAIFLRAICDEPFDDLPRIRYSDWLEETGHYEKAVSLRRMIARGEEDVLVYNKGDWLALVQHHSQKQSPIELYRQGTLQIVQPVGILSRGFIGELHCTQAEFMGGECPECCLVAHVSLTCTGCDGNRRRGGFVDQFDRLPITKVVLTDQSAVWGDLVEQGRKRAGLKPLRPNKIIEDLRQFINARTTAWNS